MTLLRVNSAGLLCGSGIKHAALDKRTTRGKAVRDMNIEFPTQGWMQFLTSRKEMLDAFDSARQKAKTHEVETFHGKVARKQSLPRVAKIFLPRSAMASLRGTLSLPA